MMPANDMEGAGKLRLKKTTNWFPAGGAFLKAMAILSDGTFKVFVFLCLKADRRTASYRASYDQLVSAIGKPRSAIESSLSELEAKGFCSTATHEEPCVGSSCVIRINDEYWPYERFGDVTAGASASSYVTAIRQQFLALGCTSQRFGASEEAQASALEKRGIPLQTVRDAMIVGACRKYVSWLNNGYSAPISSICYFDSVIKELQESPLKADYREYLPLELKRLANHWTRGLGKAPKKETPHLGNQNQLGQKS